MAEETHADRHKALHSALGELVADFITHTGKLPSLTTVMELMEWSYAQVAEPTEQAQPEEIVEEEEERVVTDEE